MALSNDAEAPNNPAQSDCLTLAMEPQLLRRPIVALCGFALVGMTSCAVMPRSTYVKGQPLTQLVGQHPEDGNPEFMTTLVRRSESKREWNRDADAFKLWCHAQGGRLVNDDGASRSDERTTSDFGAAAWQWAYSFPSRHPGQNSPAFFSAWCVNSDNAITGALFHAAETSAYYEGSALAAFLEKYGKASEAREARWKASVDRQQAEESDRREAREASQAETKAKADEALHRYEEERRRQRLARVESFRHAIKIETETNCGPVLEAKSSLMKVYSPVPAFGNEHWLRKEQLFPPDYGCRFVNGNYLPPSP